MTASVFCMVEAGAVCAFATSAIVASRRCGIRFDLHERVPLLLAVAGIAAGAAAFACHPNPTGTIGFAILAAAVTVCAVSDAATGFVFDAVTLPALAALLVCGLMQARFFESVMGAACAPAVILAIYGATRGRGIGLGDAKLAACIGAGLGVRASLYALAIAFVAGALVGVVWLFLRRIERGAEMRFAPYLAAGTIAAAMWPA